LKTHSVDIAKSKAIVLSLRHDAIFDRIGLDMANPPISDFPHLLGQNPAAAKYTIKTPDGLEMSVDPAKPGDHEKAMDYVRAKQAHEIDLETLRLSKIEAEAKANAARLAVARAKAVEIRARASSG
jgi:hypothetical protein